MKPKKHVVILSLGAGVQSTALALLIESGLLPGIPRPEAAIFADTKAEPRHVIDTLDWLEDKLPYPIIRTTWGNLAQNTWKAITGMPVPERGHHKPGYIDIPVFSDKGLAKRQCTSIYKVRPIKQAIRDFAKSAPPALTATQYLGISSNETKRAKPAREAWLTNRYPLIEHSWSRADCLMWLDKSFPGHPVSRSACYFCPFRNSEDWREIAASYPNLYADALAMERQMREHPRGPWHLRAGGLDKVKTPQEDLQGRLFGPDAHNCAPI